MKKSMFFNKEYVGTILSPFVGKKIRMRGDESIPFFLETSMESSIQIKIENMGIGFVLIDNYYIKRDLDKAFSEAFQEIDIFPFRLDSLLKDTETNPVDAVVYKKLLEHMQAKLNPQVAYTYYNMIKSLRVEEERFFLNGIEFYITKH